MFTLFSRFPVFLKTVFVNFGKYSIIYTSILPVNLQLVVNGRDVLSDGFNKPYGTKYMGQTNWFEKLYL